MKECLLAFTLQLWWPDNGLSPRIWIDCLPTRLSGRCCCQFSTMVEGGSSQSLPNFRRFRRHNRSYHYHYLTLQTREGLARRLCEGPLPRQRLSTIHARDNRGYHHAETIIACSRVEQEPDSCKLHRIIQGTSLPPKKIRNKNDLSIKRTTAAGILLENQDVVESVGSKLFSLNEFLVAFREQYVIEKLPRR